MTKAFTDRMSKEMRRALNAERIVSLRKKRILFVLADSSIILFILLTILGYSDPSWREARMPLIGSLFVISSLLLSWYLFEAYIYSLIGRLEEKDEPCSLEAGRILFCHKKNLFRAFLKSRAGQQVFSSVGISQKKISALQKDFVSKKEIEESDEYITLKTITRVLTTSSEVLRQLLKEERVTVREFIGAAEWVERECMYQRERDAWWRREELERIPGTAKDWAQGATPVLDCYAHDLYFSLREISLSPHPHEKELRIMEHMLAEERGTHIFCIEETDGVNRDLIKELTKEIENGNVLPQLEYCRVVELETALIVQSFNEAEGFKKTLTAIQKELQRAKNIILVIHTLPLLTEASKRYGVSYDTLLTSLLAVPKVRTIICASKEELKSIYLGEEWRRHFHTIETLPLTKQEQLILLEEQALRFSDGRYIDIHYPALVSLAQNTNEEDEVEKLSELIFWTRAKNISVVTRALCEQFLKEKYPALNEERRLVYTNRIADIEQELRGCIPEQKIAIQGIVKTIENAQANRARRKLPIASLLFLGPTKRKMEIAHVLCRTLFGGEESFMRIATSDYVDDTHLLRTLTEGLRHRPASLVFIENFEQTSAEVQSFLCSLFTEGKVQDEKGEMIHADRALFVVSTNAGERHIEWLAEQKKEIEDEEESIVAGIIHDSILSEETIRSFDGVVLVVPTTEG